MLALGLIESPVQILNEPIAIFVLLLAIVLVIPPLFERLKLPGLVGLLVAGIIFGKNGLGWLQADTETMKLFADVGKIYLMFVAGLEIDLAQFQKTRNRSLSFGGLTFALPMIGGIAVGLLFNFGWLAAILIGSLLASHTLLAYPIIQRLGVAGDEAVTITVGATIFTDLASLVVLAICLGVSQGDFTAFKLFTLLGSLALYTIAVLWGLKRFGQYFFRKTGQDEGNQFLFVLLSVFLCSIVAQLIGVEGIIGAFLAGLAINSVIGNGPVKEKTEFLGTVLFIPMFFVDMGLLLDLKAFSSIIDAIDLPLAIVGTLFLAKLLAAWITQQLFRYNRAQLWTMASLSFPQVAATLAAAVVGYEANIISVQVFNSVILMMLLTSVLGPIITERSARLLAAKETLVAGTAREWLPLPNQGLGAFVAVVPVYNPKTEHFLLELAALIAGAKQGRVIPLAIAVAKPQLGSSEMSRSIAHCRHRLEAAEGVKSTADIVVDPRLRVDHNIPQAICHVGLEENADLIVLGLGNAAETWFFHPIHNQVMGIAHCPVLGARLLSSPKTFKQILVPIKDPNPSILRVLRLAQALASANQGKITLLHISSGGRTAEMAQRQIKAQLSELVALLPAVACPVEVCIQKHDHVMTALCEAATEYDVVMLRSQRHQADKGVSLGTYSSLPLAQLSGSIILVGDSDFR